MAENGHLKLPQNSGDDDIEKERHVETFEQRTENLNNKNKS